MQRASANSTTCRITSVKSLVVLLGPTGVGKTALSIGLAQQLGTEIISADSRQVYRELPIGTAAPTIEECLAVPHHLVGTRSIHEPYSASLFADEASHLVCDIHCRSDYALASGGAMMYIDALCYGIDDMPDVDPEVRSATWQRYTDEGLEGILAELRVLDPVYYGRVDHHNYKRVLHGYEMCISTGKPFSSFHSGHKQTRPWRTIKVGLTRERDELYERINQRVIEMLRLGLEDEARQVYPYRHLNALNTVGYKEMFAYFDGDISYDEAIRQLQRNSRIYARKQLSWWRRDSEIKWFHPDDKEGIRNYIQEQHNL